MKNSTELCLINVFIDSNYKNRLLNHLSQINNVHIKPKSGGQLKVNVENTDPLTESIKKLRYDFNILCRKLNIDESAFSELNISKNDRTLLKVNDTEELIDKISDDVNSFNNRIIELEKYIDNAKIKLEDKTTLESCYKFLDKFHLNRFSLTYFDQLKFKVFTIFSKNLENLKSLFKVTEFPNFYRTERIANERIAFFIIYPKDKEDDFKEKIDIIHAKEIHILKKYLAYNKINFIRIEKEISKINKTLWKYKKELEEMKEKYLLKFATMHENVQNIENYIWAENQFEYFSLSQLLLKFYCSLNKKNEIEKDLNENFNDKIVIESINIPKTLIVKDIQLKEKVEKEKSYDKNKISKDLRSETPKIMKNNRFFKPFEIITKMYGVPSYSEIDPTPFIAITFPLLFGLMFGDIGHGLCLVIAGLIGGILFRNRKKNVAAISWVIFYCGWGAIFAGFLYGEFFGQHSLFGTHIEPLLENPLNNIMTLLKFVIIVGLIHINLGWFLQFLNYWRNNKKYLSITDSLFKILFLTGGSFLILSWGFDINSWLIYPYPILLPLIPGLLLLVSKPIGKTLSISYLKEKSYSSLLGEGSMETFETFLSVLSNMSSYLRLLALALAHIALMISVQAIIGLMQGDFIIIEILKIGGLIFGNVIIILFEGLLAFVNTIRLHFYEFFFKFYQGNGFEFVDFNLDEKFSKIKFNIKSETDAISEEIEKEINLSKENIDRAITYISSKYLQS